MAANTGLQCLLCTYYRLYNELNNAYICICCCHCGGVHTLPFQPALRKVFVCCHTPKCRFAALLQSNFAATAKRMLPAANVVHVVRHTTHALDVEDVDSSLPSEPVIHSSLRRGYRNTVRPSQSVDAHSTLIAVQLTARRSCCCCHFRICVWPPDLLRSVVYVSLFSQ